MKVPVTVLPLRFTVSVIGPGAGLATLFTVMRTVAVVEGPPQPSLTV